VTAPQGAPGLEELLLAPEQAAAIEAHGNTDAAVLLPLYGWPEAPGLVFTERHPGLRRHAGEISFPGGRRDFPEEDLIVCALRETKEEIGLDPGVVEVAGALPPVSTMVTSFKVHPFVGRIPVDAALEANPEEVERVLRFSLADLRNGYGKRRLVRRGIPLRMDTFVVGEDLIWGATARILTLFLQALEGPRG
jgi:8-oxo-dGTP pyrophosphatase MutT (NUDIX family)